MDPLWILFLGMLVVIGGVLLLRMHAFIALVLGALVVAAATPSVALQEYAAGEVKKQNLTQKQASSFLKQTIGERIGVAFGRTCGDIGILVALASIVGKCLLDSGGADRIVRTTLRWLGEAQASLAFLVSGFVLGIPVFFDTVFYLMIPLGKALNVRTGKNYLLYVLSITAGATMTHSLVPPTPGPLAVAEILGIEMGLMIRAGLVVGAFCAAAGYAYAVWINSRWQIPLRETAGMSLAELEKLASRDERELPPFWLSLLPIALPVVLISLPDIMKAVWSVEAGSVDPLRLQIDAIVATLSHKNLALLLSAVVAVGTLVWIRRVNRHELSSVIQECVLDAGTIILVTAAGGAFGGVLQQTGIAGRIHQLAPDSHAWLLPVAWLVAVMIRTAQGSATVAMLTTAGIFKSLIVPDMAFHPVYIALAIGCGSKLFAWMNDSGFWVICKMSGLTEGETLKAHSPMLVLMGVVGLITTMIGAWLFPLI